MKGHIDDILECAREAGLLDTVGGMIAIYSGINVPIVVLPPPILGWIAQRSLVKAMTMGAVKEE